MNRYGPQAELLDEALATANTDVVYGKAFSLKFVEAMAAMFTFTSSGVVNVKIELEQSDVKPATENASDTNFVVPENASPISVGILNELRHLITINPLPFLYGRFKYTGLSDGNGTNAASTVITSKTSKIQDQ